MSKIDLEEQVFAIVNHGNYSDAEVWKMPHSRRIGILNRLCKKVRDENEAIEKATRSKGKR